jgi:hypothetical protein
MLPAGLNASIGAPGPHGFAVRDIGRSSFAVIRVHRIPPRVRDVRNAPLVGRDGRIEITDLPDDGSGIFLCEGMDRLLAICPTGCLPQPWQPDLTCGRGEAAGSAQGQYACFDPESIHSGRLEINVSST